jgi:hypothetical protein
MLVVVSWMLPDVGLEKSSNRQNLRMRVVAWGSSIPTVLPDQCASVPRHQLAFFLSSLPPFRTQTKNSGMKEK